MSSEYNYDEEGQFFPFFLVTVAGLVTIPITYSLLRPSKGLENTAPRIHSTYEPDHADLIEGQRRRQKRRELKIKRILTAATGWLTIAVMIYLMVVTARSTPKIWDPYEILGIGMSATEKQIQSRYRRLSVTLHPDKAQPDVSKNETVETVNERWVEIIKAYKALTDEEVRNNFIQYGNPDGKQSTSFGIALPQFLITEGNGKYILIVYGALLGVLLPYFVGKWWYGSQKMSKENVLLTSAGNMFKEYSERLDKNGVVALLSSGEEFKSILSGQKADTGSGQLQKSVFAQGDTIGMTAKDRTHVQDIEDSVRQKALTLLWAYLGRVELDDASLNDEKLEVAPTAWALNEAFLSMALAYGFTAPVLATYKTSQSIIQAMPPNSSPLLQLPHFTSSAIKHIDDALLSEPRRHVTIQRFLDISDSERRKLTKAAGISSAQYDTAMKVATQLPRLVTERTFFKVTGEKYVIPNSLVQFVVKARFIPPGTTTIPAINPSDLDDSDADDTDPTAARKAAAETKQHQVPLAHAPFFARDHSPRWHLFLADARQGKIAVPPFTFTTFDAPIVDAATGAPTFAVQTLKMQFQAPPNPGQYKFQMHLVCDSYDGFDDRRDVVLVVEEAAKADEEEWEDDISEPDEDTIAGQMAALKGNPTASPGAKRRVVQHSDSESGSGTDEDEDDESDSDTDTDTDTDEE